MAVPTQKLVRCFLAGVILAPSLVLTGWAFPTQSKSQNVPKAQKNENRRIIDGLEEKWRNAMLKNDAAVLDSLLSEDFVGIMANGTLETKDQMLANIRAGQWKLTAFDISDRKVRFYGRTALVTSLAQVEGTGPDGNLTGSYRYTRVYARDSRGTWKIVNFEANRLGHPHRPDKAGNPGSTN